MRDFRRMSAAFEPPSDFVASGGGGNKNATLWKVLGGGCLVILLILGGLFAAGAFKVVSCCSEFSDVAKTTLASQEFGQQWAATLGQGKYDAAYAQLSEDTKASQDQATFQSKAAAFEDRLKVASPRLLGTNLVNQQEGAWRWRQSYQFADSQSEDMLVLMFDVIQVAGEFRIESVDFDIRERVLSVEPPATAVLEFHSLIQDSQYEMAFSRLSEAFKTSTDEATFRKFLDAEGAVLKNSEIEVKEVLYNSEDSATVMAMVVNRTGLKAVVQYELTRPFPHLPAWQITTISPMIQTEEAVPEIQELPVESDSIEVSDTNEEKP